MSTKMITGEKKSDVVRPARYIETIFSVLDQISVQRLVSIAKVG